MSKHDFTLAEFSSRREAVRDAMRRQELDWLILVHPVSIHWLTGSDAKSYQEFQCLFLSAAAPELTVLTRDGECHEFRDDAWVDRIVGWGGGKTEDPVAAFETLAHSLALIGRRVGLEVPAYYLHPHHYVQLKELLGDSLVAEPNQLVADLKLVKSPREQEYIRRAAGIADLALDAFRRGLQVGRTELAVAGDVYQTLLHQGSGLAASPINLVSGERSCFSHGAPTERLLRAGDFGSVEYGSMYRRYTSTIGRQFSLGAPTQSMLDLFNLARRASEACLREIRPGAPATAAYEAARQVIADAGLDHCRVHTTGYGLAPGFPPTWGEPLHLMDGSPYRLEIGMVLTIEPPIFDGESRLGARLIDNVLVTADGPEILSRQPCDLIIVP